MKKRHLILSSSFLLTLCISACSGGNNAFTSSSKTIEQSSSVTSSEPQDNTSSSKEQSAQKSSSQAPKSSSSSINKLSSSSSTAKSSSSAPKSSSSQPKSSSSAPKSSSSQSSSTSEAPIIDNSGFSNINDTQVFEIHTAAQKTYLSYSGDYSQIPTDQYPNGNVHQSDSNPITLTWNYTVPSGKTVSKYSVIFGQKQDLSDGYQVNGNTNKTISFYNPYLGRNYYKLIATFTDNSKDETPIRHFEVDGTYPRNLTIGGMTNCRDMGGRVLEDGGKMRQGLIFRTSGYKYDYSTTITEDGKKEMLQHLKVKTEVNVADGSSYNLNLNGTTVKEFKMDYSGGSHHFSRNAESVKNFFNLLGDSSNYPVYFHCRIGTDRTGLCAILLSGLLGVSLNEIYQDYLFSNFGKIGEKRYIGPAAGADNIQNYIADIQSMSGKTFKNKVYNMLLAIGVAKNTLDTIISNLTEGTPAQDNDAGQVIAPGDKLVGNGVTVTTDTSDRNNPDKYFVLNSTSKSVSYTFTAPEAYEGQVVCYMGNGDSSSSKKIGDAISCKLDSTNMTIRDVTYADARMGKCSTRTNYYPVVLGNINIAKGNHTITITGTSNTMNVGGIYIFDASTSSGGGSQGGGDNPGEHTTHNYVAQSPVTNKNGKTVTTYLCECGKKYIAIGLKDYSSSTGNIGSDGKIDKNITIKWDIPAKAGEVTLQFNVKVSNSNHITNSAAVFHANQYGIKINGVSQSILLADNTQYGSLGLTTSGQYLGFCSFEIPNDTNIEIEFNHNVTDYRLLFSEQVRLQY